MTAMAMSRRSRLPAAAAIAAVSAASTLVGVLLALQRPSVAALVQGHLLGDAAATIASAGVGMLLLSRLPGHAVGRLFTAVGLVNGLAVLAAGWQEAAPQEPVALWLSEWTWRPGLGLLVGVLPLVVPNGSATRAGRVLVTAGVAAIATWTVGGALRPSVQSGPSTAVRNPLAVPGGDLLERAGLAACALLTVVAVVVLVARLIRADEATRRQLLPIMAAGLVVAGVVAIAPALGLIGVVLQDLAVLLVPLACLVAVLRLRLYDLELGIGRSLVWVTATALLVAVYVLVVQACAAALRLPSLPASLLATAVVAVAFAPLKGLVERGVMRWLYGVRGDPFTALAATTAVLASGEDPASVIPRALEELARLLRSPGARIVRDGAVIAGRAEGVAIVVLPLAVADVEVGALEVLPRGPGERYSRADERILAGLAPSFATAVAALAGQDALRAARSRLATIREDERHRVRRRLHDDVGPSLAAVAMQARTALRRLERADEAGAREAMTAVGGIATRAAEDLRAAVDALGPRALDELSFPDAIADLARGITADAVRLDLELGSLPDLPGEVQQAAYRVVAEALTNVVRHAGAETAAVSLHHHEGALDIRIVDDGRAGALVRSGGLGLASMRARVEELGGVLHLDAAHGVLVHARIPLAADLLEPEASS